MANLFKIAPQFRVPDIVKTAEYYRDVLGFKIGPYFGKPPVFVQVYRDRIEIQLGRLATGEVKTNGSAEASDVYIHVDKVDELYGEFKKTGAKIVDGPVNRIYKQRELVVQDCNGLILCFGEDISGKS